METIRLNKIEAANRQLDVAIQLLFAGGDVVAVHTLAGAASAIVSKLIEHAKPAKSWDLAHQQVCGIDAKTYFQVMRVTQNFLKHADHDPDAEHEFAVTDTSAVMFNAVLNLAELTGTLSVTQSVFQLWYVACNLDVIDASFEHRGLIRATFGDLTRRTMAYRLAVGRRELREALARPSS